MVDFNSLAARRKLLNEILQEDDMRRKDQLLNALSGEEAKLLLRLAVLKLAGKTV